MSIPARTLNQIQQLSDNDMAIVINLVEQLSAKPIDLFHDLRNDGIQNPMTEDEVDDLISAVRAERHAVSC